MKCPSKVLLYVMLIPAVTIFGNASISSANPVFQKPKPAAAAPEEEQESPPGYEEEYNCYQSATGEAEVVKRGTMLIECIEKYPKSTLMPNFEAGYRSLLFDASNNKKWQELEKLAEQWLKLHPDDYETIAMIATAAANLGHDEKYVQCMEKLYKMKPTSALPLDIAATYLKMKNRAKYIEWAELALKLPENEANFMLRLNLVQEYWEKKDLAKTMEWARAALKSANLVKDPSAETRTQLTAVRHTCYDIIGKISYEQDKYPEAVQAFRQALKVKEYAEGYYFIGRCLHAEKKADDALLWYAKTSSWCERQTKECGEFASKAKENLEKIYKTLHNDTLIGVEKIYRRAKEQPESYWISNEN
jgi:tetratricopeptide (TPR) repeat protein